MNHLPKLLILTVSLSLTACSQENNKTTAVIPSEKFSSEDEVLFQQEAALRHTLDSLKQQEKEERAFKSE